MTTDSARALLRRLGQFMDTFSGCFTRQPQRAAATQYVDGLFNDSERKSMEAMHGVAKYGVRLKDNPAPLAARLRHMLEELLDNHLKQKKITEIS